jgi:hypothetical protein
MVRLFLIVAAIWMVFLPPFFTEGACTAEFNQAALQIDKHRQELASSASAQAYFASIQIPVQVVSAERCRASRPRYVDTCGSGDLLNAAIPVKNKICRLYRDSSIRVQLQYNEDGHLRQLETRMDPFRYFSIPGTSIKLNWGK